VSDEPALFAAYPALRSRLPWRSLATTPTRVAQMGLVPSVKLWVKREDESSALFGGNKVRKLEFLLGEATAQGKRHISTLGGYGSFHVLATAMFAQAHGFAFDAAVFPQPVTPHVKACLRAMIAVGAKLHAAGSYFDLPLHMARARLHPRSYWIGMGGSTPTGTLGYVSAGLEIAAQVERGECPAPDVVYVALGSCGTAAGLWVGLALAGLRCNLVAVRVTDRIVANHRATVRLGRATLKKMGVSAPKLDEHKLYVEERFFGEEYGRATPEAERAIALAKGEGLALEGTYSGKAFAALVADAEAGLLHQQNVLFIDTYGGVDLLPLANRADPSQLPARLQRLV
jgi:D-cysteine desulfhydrase